MSGQPSNTTSDKRFEALAEALKTLATQCEEPIVALEAEFTDGQILRLDLDESQVGEN